MIDPSPAIAAVVFDCGDTLLQLRPSRAVIGRDVLAELGLPFEEHQVESAMRFADAVLRHRSSELRGDPARRADFYRELNAHIAMALGVARFSSAFGERMLEAVGRRRSWQPIAGARATLESLQQRYELHVLANWDRRLEALLDSHAMRTPFTQVWSSEQLGAEKPQRIAFERFVQHTGIDARSTVYVGNDYEPDVFGSRQVGMTPVLLDHVGRYGRGVDCQRVDDFAGLRALLLADGQVVAEAEAAEAVVE